MNASFSAGPRLRGLVAVFVITFASTARAQEACASRIDRGNLIACALAASPALLAEAAQLRAVEGRRDAARPVLPSNPVLSGSVGTRNIPGTSAVNWSVGLAQELEIAGQRGLRIDAAEAELGAQTAKLQATRQGLALAAWETYFESLGAIERSRVAASIAVAAAEFSTTVRAMAAQGLVSDVDGQVADALSLNAARHALFAERDALLRRQRLAVITGSPAQVEVVGALVPLAGTDVPPSPNAGPRPELVASSQEIVALGHRVALLRRSRVPNPIVSLYTQSDGFNERVFGVGLQLPIPLPQPIGRTAAGQIAEHVALSERATSETERLKRELTLELGAAATELQTVRRVQALYTPERVSGATASLGAIAREVKAARLPVREALVSQQALTELLLSEVDAREALAVASVRYARAAGITLEGGDR